MLKQQIYTDLVAAMKAKETVKLDTLRMLKASIMKFEVAGVKTDAQDDDVIKIIKREIKQRQDSAEQFQAVGRLEDAQKEKQEMEILMAYLPAQMSEMEVQKLIENLILETGFKSKSDFGKIMGIVMQKVAGNADGAMVKNLLQNSLK